MTVPFFPLVSAEDAEISIGSSSAIFCLFPANFIAHVQLYRLTINARNAYKLMNIVNVRPHKSPGPHISFCSFSTSSRYSFFVLELEETNDQGHITRRKMSPVALLVLACVLTHATDFALAQTSPSKSRSSSSACKYYY